ncbi:LysR family transcriptional regulator [Haliangium sp. UPWRP_2]|uniref:LysR family transcriptional regulator n=1 Tax=Haliangium sp. UPWRP_2 TaxID=1931276 RepID=UPI000B541857|nr:LysR family transcriptional regulator [Haliangium sp. UPWRP_2]PSM31353.1 LysR family transcriptional regulator [Haliangium sp. UPWRP_2]
MLQWNDLRVLLAVARAGTLAGAAAALRVNATTVGRRLGALEEALAVRLFDRTPAGYGLTQAGRDLLAHAERMEHEVQAAEREVAGADQRPAGLVRLATTEMLATRFLVPHLPRFQVRHPQIQLEVSTISRPIVLARGEADLTVRLTRPREPDVVAQRLGAIHLALYAARAYLAAYGAPERPQESLRGHRVVLFAPSRAFDVENTWFAPRLADAQVVLRSDSVSAIYAATLAGLGIALLPVLVASREPELVRLPTGQEAEPRIIWQGVHRDLMKSARVQAVMSFLTDVVATAV